MNRLEIDQGKQYFYKPDKSRLRLEAADWARNTFVPYKALAATLQVRNHRTAGHRSIEAGDKAVEHFVKRLNRAAYGQRAKEKKGRRQVPLLIVREGGGESGPALHYHAIIEVPQGKTLEEWKRICAATWGGMRESYRYNDFSDYESPGWGDYILKPRSKFGNDYIVALQQNVGEIVLH